MSLRIFALPCVARIPVPKLAPPCFTCQVNFIKLSLQLILVFSFHVLASEVGSRCKLCPGGSNELAGNSLQPGWMHFFLQPSAGSDKGSSQSLLKVQVADQHWLGHVQSNRKNVEHIEVINQLTTLTTLNCHLPLLSLSHFLSTR